MHPKFDPTKVRTHDLQIMIVHFISLRCQLWPLGHQWLLKKEIYCHIILEVWGDFECTGSKLNWCTGDWYVWFKIRTYDRSTVHPKFDPTGVQTHYPQIMTVCFMFIETSVLTTRPSVTTWFVMMTLTLTVLVMTIDALRHFETG